MAFWKGIVHTTFNYHWLLTIQIIHNTQYFIWTYKIFCQKNSLLLMRVGLMACKMGYIAYISIWGNRHFRNQTPWLWLWTKTNTKRNRTILYPKTLQNRNVLHCWSAVTRKVWCLKLPESRLFIQQLIQLKTKKIIKILTDAFWVESSQKFSSTGRFPCHDVIMFCSYLVMLRTSAGIVIFIFKYH